MPHSKHGQGSFDIADLEGHKPTSHHKNAGNEVQALIPPF